MSEFVASFATDQLLPPWRSEGCQSWGFAVEVSRANVANYLDAYLNGDYPDRAPYQYVPLEGPQFGLITHAYHPSIVSRAANQPRNPLSFREVNWTLPVRRYRIAADQALVDPKTVWVQPFSFCDNASVLFASREIWGADMAYALVNQAEPTKASLLHVDVAIEGIREFSPFSRSELLGCLHIEQASQRSIELDAFLGEHPSMRAFAQRVMDFHEPSRAPELNNLKQFRDAYRMRDAIYRGIVASRATHEVKEVAFYGGGSTIDIMWSASVAEMATSLLNLKAPPPIKTPKGHRALAPDDPEPRIEWRLPRVEVKPTLAFSFTSDVCFEVIDTLFTYGAGDRSALRAASPRKS